MGITKSGQEKPSEKLVEKSIEGVIEESVVELTKNPTGEVVENLLEEIKEKPIEKSIGELVEEQIEEKSAKISVEKAIEELKEKPIEEIPVYLREEAVGEIEESSKEKSAEELKEEEKAELAEKARKKRKKIVLGIIISCSTLLVIYLGMAKYFSNHFYFGSEINSINVSGKSVEEAKALVVSEIPNYTLSIKERNGVSEQIKGDDVGLRINSGEEISKLKEGQSGFKWISSLFNSENSKMTIGLSYNANLLKEQVDKLSCVNDKNVVEPKNASFEYKGNGYEIVKETPGTKIDKAALYSQVASSILQGQNEVDLESVGAYISPQYDSKSDKVLAVKDTLDKYTSANITYTFGNKKEIINGSTISKWLKIDDNFKVALDEEKVKAYFLELSKTYDTVGKARKFVTTSGVAINLDGGDYGWSIDSVKETESLIKDITEGKTVTKEPSYEQTAFSETNKAAYSSDDVGKTYVEINLSSQHLWFYKNGSLIVQGDIVSGNMSSGHTTPKGIYALKYKERNAILRGPGYATRVSFWMPFNQDIGIHDATWRGSFGGGIYWSNGSHGCINSPYSLANTIFDNIEPGTPIVCYY